MSLNYWDAVAFVPNKKIFFMGFGSMANYNQRDIRLKLQWVIDEEASGVFEVDL